MTWVLLVLIVANGNAVQQRVSGFNTLTECHAMGIELLRASAPIIGDEVTVRCIRERAT